MRSQHVGSQRDRRFLVGNVHGVTRPQENPQRECDPP